MANEASVSVSLTVQKGEISDRHTLSFRSDVGGSIGPTPGAFTASVTGTDVSLAQLTQPGWTFIKNLDAANFVIVGKYDGASFHPLLEFGPGEGAVVKLYRFLASEFVGTGTPSDANTLRVMADTAPCAVYIGAYEK